MSSQGTITAIPQKRPMTRLEGGLAASVEGNHCTLPRELRGRRVTGTARSVFISAHLRIKPGTQLVAASRFCFSPSRRSSQHGASRTPANGATDAACMPACASGTARARAGRSRQPFGLPVARCGPSRRRLAKLTLPRPPPSQALSLSLGSFAFNATAMAPAPATVARAAAPNMMDVDGLKGLAKEVRALPLRVLQPAARCRGALRVRLY